jgi:hypothetical protein
LDATLGPLAIGGACIAWALDNNLTRKVSLADPLQIVEIKGLVAGPINLALGLLTFSRDKTYPRPSFAYGALSQRGGAMLGSLAVRLSTALKLRVHRNLLDRRLDQQLGLHTCGMHFQPELDLRGDSAQFAMEYKPTPRFVFMRMVAALNIDCKRFVFIDLGSGKGRILVLASQLSFARVEGVELSAPMHRIALQNIDKLGEQGARIASHNLDATAYEFPREPFVIFAFNPFWEAVVERVVASLERSLRAYPREGYILYLNAKHRRPFDS